MSWLLDTHVWLWSQLDPQQLGGQTAALLLDREQELHVSTISTLEIARLVELGHVELGVEVEEWVRLAMDALPAVTIELSHSIAAESYRLPAPFHRDPADRILVATARTRSLALLTADRRILDYPHVGSHDARS
ncbi:MAG: type II toxin-antitoxin system VapC family toxin [Armatimonadetes bacterium]|nr:type II toxin-antitoxin system VapC family toxin [Armatimonadota bacterium]